MNNQYNLTFNCYGPQNQIDALKFDIITSINKLHDEINEEKFLSNHIQVNNLPTPYKQVVTNSVGVLAKLRSDVFNAEYIDDIKESEKQLKLLKITIKHNLNIAFKKTEDIITTIHKHLNREDIRSKLKDIIKKNYGEKFKDRKTVVSNALKIKIKQLIEEKRREFQGNSSIALLDKEIAHVAHCLTYGNLAEIKEHPFFVHYPEKLREYYPENHNISRRSFVIFIRTRARKLYRTFDPVTQQHEIYENLVTYIEKLAAQETSAIFSRGRVTRLRQYLQSLKEENERNQEITDQEPPSSKEKKERISLLEKAKNKIRDLLFKKKEA